MTVTKVWLSGVGVLVIGGKHGDTYGSWVVALLVSCCVSADGGISGAVF
jgi:hypothetical protein